MKIKILNHSLKIENWILKIRELFVTDSERLPEISETRDISATQDRDIAPKKLIMESLCCPYCQSTTYVKKGFRMKKREKVQLYLCLSCKKVFTPRATKGKHYPLAIMLDAISIYNLGYSLEQTCRIVQVRSQDSKLDASGSEFPRVTEHASFISEASGRAPSDSSRSKTRAPASTFDGDGLSTNIISPTDSSATPASIYQSNTPSANVSSTKKEAPVAGSFSRAGSNVPAPDTRRYNLSLYNAFVKWWSETWRKAGGTIPIQPLGGTKRVSGALPPSGIHLPTTSSSIPTDHITLQPSTLSAWIAETEELCRFCRMREYAIKKFPPKEMVITATLAHRQLYRFRFHRGKADLIIREEYGHRKFAPLRDFLELVPAECPHQYFSQGLRASEAPLTFSKTAMIVRGKTNYATRLAAFVLQSVSDRKARHEAIQKFMLANDSVTVASEVPVYLTRDDMEHMKTQLGFEIYQKISRQANNQFSNSNLQSKSNDSISKIENSLKIENWSLKINELPKLITGHIDLLQIRNGQIHILDYKPNAAKEQPIEQLTLYAMALSRLTGLRLFEFKCAWFDEKDYFEFYPLHVLHKPKKAQRRRNVMTQEGTYQVNKSEKKIENVRPISI